MTDIRDRIAARVEALLQPFVGRRYSPGLENEIGAVLNADAELLALYDQAVKEVSGAVPIEGEVGLTMEEVDLTIEVERFSVLRAAGQDDDQGGGDEAGEDQVTRH